MNSIADIYRESPDLVRIIIVLLILIVAGLGALTIMGGIQILLGALTGIAIFAALVMPIIIFAARH